MNKLELLVAANCKNIDINKSVTCMHEFGLCDNFGTQFRLTNQEDFIDTLVSYKSVIDLTGFEFNNGKWVCSIPSEDDVAPSTTTVTETKIILPEQVEVGTEVVTDLLGEVDWVWVEALENTKESKLELDKYAEKFGVNLKGNRSLKNMIRDFKSAIKG